MMQIVMNADTEDEQVMDLVDTPEIVLIQFGDMIIRHRDLRNPDVRSRVQDIINALKAKAGKSSGGYNPYDTKSFIEQAEDILKQFAENA
jgi:hypothetical protein